MDSNVNWIKEKCGVLVTARGQAAGAVPPCPGIGAADFSTQG